MKQFALLVIFLFLFSSLAIALPPPPPPIPGNPDAEIIVEDPVEDESDTAPRRSSSGGGSSSSSSSDDDEQEVQEDEQDSSDEEVAQQVFENQPVARDQNNPGNTQVAQSSPTVEQVQASQPNDITGAVTGTNQETSFWPLAFIAGLAIVAVGSLFFFKRKQ